MKRTLPANQRLQYELPKFQGKHVYRLPAKLCCDDVDDLVRPSCSRRYYHPTHIICFAGACLPVIGCTEGLEGNLLRNFEDSGSSHICLKVEVQTKKPSPQLLILYARDASFNVQVTGRSLIVCEW
jgi:hypothetical protein